MNASAIIFNLEEIIFIIISLGKRTNLLLIDKVKLYRLKEHFLIKGQIFLIIVHDFSSSLFISLFIYIFRFLYRCFRLLHTLYFILLIIYYLFIYLLFYAGPIDSSVSKRILTEMVTLHICYILFYC